MTVESLAQAAREYKTAVMNYYEHIQRAHDSYIQRGHTCFDCDSLGHYVEVCKEQLTAVALRFES